MVIALVAIAIFFFSRKNNTSVAPNQGTQENILTEDEKISIIQSLNAVNEIKHLTVEQKNELIKKMNETSKKSPTLTDQEKSDLMKKLNGN